MLRKTVVVLGASLALVLGTGGAALADEPVTTPPTDICVPSEGSPAVETTYKQVPNPDYVPGRPGVHHPAETHEETVADQRYSWNPQGPQDELDRRAGLADARRAKVDREHVDLPRG